MYKKFTDRARRVMQLANQEAQRFNHEYIGTEHILLGLVREGGGVAALILFDLDVDLREIQREVERLVAPGPEMITMGKLPLTPRAKKVIELAMEGASDVHRDCLGTFHILLGLLREQEGVAAQVLNNLGVTLDLVLKAESCVLHVEASKPSDETFREKVGLAFDQPSDEPANKQGTHREKIRMEMWCDVYTSDGHLKTERMNPSQEKYLLKDKPSTRSNKADRAVREFDAMFPIENVGGGSPSSAEYEILIGELQHQMQHQLRQRDDEIQKIRAAIDAAFAQLDSGTLCHDEQ